MTAILLSISRRFNQIGAAAQAEIGRLKQKEVESQGEITRLLQEIDGRENHETFLEHEIEEKRDKIEELERKNNEQEEEKSELERLKGELDRKYSELQEIYSREIYSKKISCPVCLEYFDTEAHQPYALSCPHMVCAHCLDQARDSRNSQGRFLRSSRHCPVCHTPVNTPLKKICLQP